MTEVYKITGYTGAKSGDVDKISSSEDDSDILDNYFDEATGAISDIISSYGAINRTDISLTLPSNWKETVKPSLETNLESYIVNYICLKWFNLAKKEDVSYYNEVLKTISSNIVKLICERKRPVR